jgi:hypothetical protein
MAILRIVYLQSESERVALLARRVPLNDWQSGTLVSFQFFSFQLVYAHAHIDETKCSIQENNEK